MNRKLQSAREELHHVFAYVHDMVDKQTRTADDSIQIKVSAAPGQARDDDEAAPTIQQCSNRWGGESHFCPTCLNVHIFPLLNGRKKGLMVMGSVVFLTLLLLIAAGFKLFFG